MTRSRLLLWTVVALVLCGAVAAALQRDPWDPDETRYLEVSREMLANRAPLVLSFNGASYADKPPLHFWIMAPFTALLGADSALAAVAPSLLALIGLALAIPLIGRRAGLDPGTADLAAALALGTMLPAVVTTIGRMDLLFALWCALALAELVALTAVTTGQPRHHLLLWLWLALATLTKGPLALALTLAAALAFAAWDRSLLRRVVAGWGPLLAIAIVVSWMMPAILAGDITWLRTVVVDQSAARMVASFAHAQPWWYHLVFTPLTLLPWSPAILLAVPGALRRHGPAASAMRLLALYPLTTLGVLSLISSKTVLYPLPLLAPAALVAAAWLSGDAARAARRVVVTLGGASLLLVAVLLTLVVAPHEDLALSSTARAVLGLALALPATAAAALAVRGRIAAAIACLTLACPLFVATGMQVLVPPVNRFLSLRPFASAWSEATNASTESGLAYLKVQPGFVLFTQRRFEIVATPAALHHALARGRVVAINSKDARRVAREHGLSWSVRAEVGYRHSQILLIARDTTSPCDD